MKRCFLFFWVALACWLPQRNTLLALTDDTSLIVASADTEGHIGPCRECPHHPGLGGLSRRATVVAGLRKVHQGTLLVDVGNFLVGSESLESKGKVIVAAYDALGYDSVNLCHRDFWFGKAATLELLKEAKFTPISANFLDDEKGEPLVKPYVVKRAGGERIGIIGVAQAPAGRDFLPHLKERLGGIRMETPVDALAKWLPKAKAESDRIILLYYGSASGLGPIQEKYGTEFVAILVSGIRPEHLPKDAKPPLVATSNHGRDLAHVRIIGAGTQTKIEVNLLAIEPTIAPSAAMEKVLEKFKSFARP